jgi:hypothetical protein
VVAKPFGFVNSPIRLGPSSDHGKAEVTVARHLPFATLCSLAGGEDCFGFGAAVGLVEGEAPGIDKIEVTTVPKKGAGSSPTVDPSFMGMTASHAGGSALIPHGEEVGLGEGPFAWPHPANSHEALFEVNDVAEQAMWGGASQSHEGVLVTLSKLADVAAAVVGLGAKAQRLMTEEVPPREQVWPRCFALSFGLAM